MTSSESDPSHPKGDGPRTDRQGERLHGRYETANERYDRNWVELLQELRVTQTGAQIITGFLLTLPFQSRFTELSSSQVLIYLALVVLSATTTVLMVAPVTLHRFLFQRHAKGEVVRIGHRTAVAGLYTLGLVVVGAVLFIFDVVVGRTAALVAGGAGLVLVTAVWVVVPKVSARPHQPDEAPEDRTPAE